MSVWTSVIGQDRAQEVFIRAAQGSRSGSSAMTHAWLVTGPPGSGRSTAAQAFAAALQCNSEPPGCGQCQSCQEVLAKTHPDVRHMATERVIIKLDEVTDLVELSQQAPIRGKWNVIIIEDADRMVDQTSNLLLKSLEEPPEKTVWILCAPSPQDVLTTIRSRCRQVNLAIPSFESIAQLLSQRDGIDYETAYHAAHIAQAHVGMAKGLALNPERIAQRRDLIHIATGVRSTFDAIYAAEDLIKKSKEVFKDRIEELNESEVGDLKAQYGYDRDEEKRNLPPHVKSALKRLEEDQNRREKRTNQDFFDRIFLDLLSLYRDVFTVQINAECDLINSDLDQLVRTLAANSNIEATMYRVKVITQARERLKTNVDLQRIIEAMLVALRPQAGQPLRTRST